MASDRFNSLLKFATALSLAGWVARTDLDQLGQLQHFWHTDDSQNPTLNQDRYLNFNDEHYLERYPNGFLQNYPQPSQPSSNNFPKNILRNCPGNNENFSENYSELKIVPTVSNHEAHDLLSWEEAYRRGDVTCDSNYVLPIITSNLDDLNDVSISDEGYVLVEPDHSVASDISSLFTLDSPELQDINDIDVKDLFNVDLLQGLHVEEEKLHLNENVTDLNPGEHCVSGKPDIGNFAEVINELNSLLGESEVQPAGTTSNWEIPNPSNIGNTNIDDYIRSFVEADDNNYMVSESVHDSTSMLSTECIRDALVGLDPLPQLVADESISLSEELIWDAVENDGKDERMSTLDSGSGPSLPHASKSTVLDPSHFQPVTEGSVDFLSNQIYKHSPISYLETIKEGTLPNKEWPHSSSSQSGTTSSKVTKQHDVVAPDLPFTKDELVDMDIDKFNNIISKFDQVRQIVLKDLRKKGKNKTAARNSRKRKLDVLDDLDTDVESLMRKKELLMWEQQLLMEETRLIRDKTSMLSDYILENLCDEFGNPYSHSHTLEYTVDGNVYLVPLK